MKIYVCCVPVQIPYLMKSVSGDIIQNPFWAKSDSRVFKSTISSEQNDEIA